MNLLKSTFKHKKYWSERKIDWNQSYLSTVDHPHRNVLMYILSRFPWISLYEVGCGPGANLKKICQTFKNKQIGGCDVSEDAIKLAKETFTGAILKVGSAEDIMMSDNSVDVILSDMALIYIDPFKIDKVIKELKRVTRRYIVICELTSNSWWEQLKTLWNTGYHCHNYKKLLEKHGFYDIMEWKMTPEMWPGGGQQEKIGKFIIAKVIKRK